MKSNTFSSQTELIPVFGFNMKGFIEGNIEVARKYVHIYHKPQHIPVTTWGLELPKPCVQGVQIIDISYKSYMPISEKQIKKGRKKQNQSITPLTFRSFVTHHTTSTPTETCIIPFSELGDSTILQEIPARNKAQKPL